MEVNKLSKKTLLSKVDAIKFQIITHCFINKIPVSDADVSCITLLAVNKGIELHTMCNKACELKIFKTPQSVRNALNKIEKKKLIVKEGKNKKKLSLSRDMNIVTEGNILLDYNFLSVETSKS